MTEELARAAAELCTCIEGAQPDDFRERARVVATALGALYVAALRAAPLLDEPGPIIPLTGLPAVEAPESFGRLGPFRGAADPYRACRHAVYQDEYGREYDVIEQFVASDVLAVHACVAPYVRGLSAGTLARGDALRSMMASLWVVRPQIPRVLRALDELLSW